MFSILQMWTIVYEKLLVKPGGSYFLCWDFSSKKLIFNYRDVQVRIF